VLAKFANPGGMTKSRDNAFLASANSGTPLIVNPGSAAGTIVSGAVEMSNVDLGQEFTNLIIAQRGFQANARTISTGDEMLAELVNLKR
jgi:flagellar hook protein FlgE